MFTKNFNAEKAIKLWATIIRLAGWVIAALSVPAAIIVACIDFEYLWWVGLIILGGGGLMLLPVEFLFAILWGYGDIVENTKKISGGASATVENKFYSALPEL